jgi:hypothetical protein
MRRTVLLLSVAALLLASCGSETDEGQDAQPTGAPQASASGSAGRRIAISGAVFEALYEAELGDQPEGTYGQVILNEQICGFTLVPPGHPDKSDVVQGVWGEDTVCQEPFSSEEKTALVAALPDLPGVWFTPEPGEVIDRIMDGDLAGIGVLLSLGPIEGAGPRVEVPARSSCGLQCGRFVTFVAERGHDGWEVTGTTGLSGMA